MAVKQRVLLTLALLVFALGDVCTAEPGAKTLIVAHRGLMRHAPENTLANFRACLELRLGFEFDVHLTKDGHLVCLHDGTLNRTTNGTGRVDEFNLAQIRELDAGGWFDPSFAGEKVATVEEVLKLISEYRKHDVLIAADLKAENVEEEVARLAQKFNVLNRIVFIGRTISDVTVRGKIKRVAGRAQVAALVVTKDELRTMCASEKAEWFYFRFLPSPNEVRMARVAGKKIFIAGPTVSDDLPDNWSQATRVGVDAILTDYPLELREMLKNGPEKKKTEKPTAKQTSNAIRVVR